MFSQLTHTLLSSYMNTHIVCIHKWYSEFPNSQGNSQFLTFQQINAADWDKKSLLKWFIMQTHYIDYDTYYFFQNHIMINWLIILYLNMRLSMYFWIKHNVTSIGQSLRPWLVDYTLLGAQSQCNFSNEKCFFLQIF